MSTIKKVFMRNKDNKPFGLIYATLNEEKELVYGISLCSSKDQFRKDVAHKKAYAKLCYHPMKLEDLGVYLSKLHLHTYNYFTHESYDVTKTAKYGFSVYLENMLNEIMIGLLNNVQTT